MSIRLLFGLNVSPLKHWNVQPVASAVAVCGVFASLEAAALHAGGAGVSAAGVDADACAVYFGADENFSVSFGFLCSSP